jgi:uncharacterized protein YcfJ
VKNTVKVILATAVCGLFIAGAAPADAKGCLKGAAVGGLAGHVAGHGLLGAAGGCAVGHHMANKEQREGTEQRSQVTPSDNRNP